jgi:ribosomal protein S18 acetylase RimI-like enzyme
MLEPAVQSWPPSTDFASLADRGWPALERVDVGGWTARFAGGVTKRANSVHPAGPIEHPALDAAVAVAEDAYRDRGLVPVFQLGDGDAALHELLSARGYLAQSETLVLAAGVDAVLTGAGSRRVEQSEDAPVFVPSGASVFVPSAPGASVSVGEKLDDEWLDLWWSVDGRGGHAEREVARRIMTGVRSLYATASDDAGVASVARLALVRERGHGWGGLYAVATRPDARRRGLALAVIRTLASAGRQQGVESLWLQVLADNEAALSMYAALGFRRVASYRYLTATQRA